MKKLILILVCVVSLIHVSAQKTIINDPNAQVRTVGSFHAIEVSNSIDLYLSQGNEEAVAVSAKDPKHISQIITVVEDGVLKIKLVNTGRIIWNTGNQQLKAYVSFKTLDKLSASGSSDVYVDGAISSDNLSIHLSGSSDFKGSVKVNELSMDQSGSSDATISGHANNLTVHISGASDIKGYDLVVDNCTAHASGSSDLNITVNKELNAQASGSSDIYYRGSAVIKDLHSSGSSSVSKKD
jgi:putative autotransporter adhesin-like protein